MRLIYPEVLLKRRGLELLPLAEPLHYCREIIFAITIAGRGEIVQAGSFAGMHRMIERCAVGWTRGQKC